MNFLYSLHQQYRYATAPWRMLPHFIIIGAQKSGTSSLYQYLATHPQLHPATVKEVHYFDGGLLAHTDNYAQGERWYRSHFPLAIYPSHHQAYEASPLYLYHPLVPQRIAKLLPHIRLIALLRNPTDRAVSHYFHTLRHHSEPLPLMQALLAEDERLQPILAQQHYQSNIFRHYSYKMRGIYHLQIQAYLRYFAPHQLLILDSETFFANPHQILEKIYHFLELDAQYFPTHLTPANVADNRAQVPPDVYAYLHQYFAPHNEQLYQLIGKRFQW